MADGERVQCKAQTRHGCHQKSKYTILYVYARPVEAGTHARPRMRRQHTKTAFH